MSNIVHVEPIGDLVEHEDEDCVCGPTVEPVPRDDGSMGWLVIHHSLDGREAREEAAALRQARRTHVLGTLNVGVLIAVACGAFWTAVALGIGVPLWRAWRG